MNASEVVFRSVGRFFAWIPFYICLLFSGVSIYRALPASRPPIEVSVEKGGIRSLSKWVVRTRNTSSETIRVKMIFANPKTKQRSRLHSFDLTPNRVETTGRFGADWDFNPGDTVYIMSDFNHKVLVARFSIENDEPVLHRDYITANLFRWNNKD